jgi:KaiC/GvpD/RAD55 family RecA-like ATPase
MTIDELLDKLEDVQPSGTGFVAICPAHDDSAASLSIAEGEERLLLNCFAGCTQDAILERLGLTWRDIVYDSGPNYAAIMPEAVYPYTDEAGNPLFEAVRMPGKKFRQRHYDPQNPDAKQDGYVYNLEGVQRVIYRLPEVRKAIADGRTIYLVEGEKDANRLWDEGYAATCNPMGAGKWRPEYTGYFVGAKQVFIIQDRDEPGRNHAQKVKDALEAIGVPVTIWQAKQGKDVSDHFDAGFAINDLVQPRKMPKRGIITVKELTEDDLDAHHVPEPFPQYYLVPGVEASGMRPGRLYAGGAYTGDGKTTIALQGTASIASQGIKTGYFTMEMVPRDLKHRLYQHKGLSLELLEDPTRMTDADRALLRDAAAEIAEWPLEIIYDTHLKVERVVQEIYDREYEFVVIDHLHRIGFGDRRHLEEQIKTLTNVTLDANITMLVLCQLRRFQRGKDMVAYPPPLLQDFRETEVIGNEASLAFAVWRQRDEQGLSYLGDSSQFRVLKNRYSTGPKNQTGHIELLTFDRRTQLFSGGGLFSAQQAEATHNILTPQGDDPWEGADDGISEDDWG